MRRPRAAHAAARMRPTMRSRAPTHDQCGRSDSCGHSRPRSESAARRWRRRGHAVPRHERAVDAVLPSPHPVAFQHERAARGDRVPIAGGDERERMPLRHDTRKSGSLRSARRRLAASGGPCRIANTPDFGPRVRRLARRSRPPRTRTDATSSAGGRRPARIRVSSHASPAAREPGLRAGRRGPDDPVDRDAPAVRDDRRCRARRRWRRCSSAARRRARRRSRPKRARTAGGCSGGVCAWSVISAKRGAAARSDVRRRCCIASSISTPPAPPPTTAIAAHAARRGLVLQPPSMLRETAANGLTASVCSAAPGTRMSGVEPMSSDSEVEGLDVAVGRASRVFV